MRPIYVMALAAGAVCVVGFWHQQRELTGQRVMWLGAAWLGSLCAAVWASRHAHGGTLACKLGKWTWHTGAQSYSGTMTVLVDLQATLLVAMVTTDGRRFWYCLRRRSDPSAWYALRRAVVSTADRRHRSDDRTDDGAPT